MTDASGSEYSVDHSAVPAAPVIATLPPTIGYPITLKRFIILNFVTLGIFQLVWGYKTFKALLGPGKGKTFASAGFSLFLGFSLFEAMKLYEAKSEAANRPIKFQKFALAISFFILVSFAKVGSRVPGLPDWFFYVVEIVALTPLCIVQHKVNQLNKALQPGIPFNTRMTGKSWIGVITGVILFLAASVVYALLSPEILTSGQ